MSDILPPGVLTSRVTTVQAEPVESPIKVITERPKVKPETEGHPELCMCDHCYSRRIEADARAERQLADIFKKETG